MSAEPVFTKGGTQHDSGHAWKPESIRAYENLKEYKPKTVAWVTPVCSFPGTKTPMYPVKVVNSWMTLDWPMNQARTPHLEALDMEVGEAYEMLFGCWLNKDEARARLGDEWAEMLSKMAFMFTTEHDNVLPPNAVMELLRAIYTCIDCGKDIDALTWLCPDGHRGLDAIGGLYWCKGLPSRPMAYGDPKDGDDFRPISVTDAIAEGKVIEVNGVAMGCTLFRRGIFENVSRPWFETTSTATQDLAFCSKAKREAGARFAVAANLRVGHLDITSGELF